MRRYEQFAHCPRCGHPYEGHAFSVAETAFRCEACAFVFYQNSVPAASAVIPWSRDAECIILLKRATSPHIGKLALPGGILGYGEDPAEAACREANEETSLEVKVDRLLSATLVRYLYLGAEMSMLELSYLMEPIDADVKQLQTQEASEIAFYNVERMLDNASQFAFPEQLQPIRRYAEQLGMRCRGR